MANIKGATKNADMASHAFEFMETMMTLHEMALSEAIAIDEVRDSQRRLKQVMDSISTDDNQDQLKSWGEQYDASMSAALDITNPAERKQAEFAVREKGRGDLALILRDQGDVGFAAVSARLNLAILQITKRPRPRDLILRSVLIASVSAIESLLAESYRARLRHQPPESLGADKEFSLSELLSYGSIEEVINSLIERKVDIALRGGIDDWAALYEKYGIRFRELCIDWDSIVEIFQRRNAFIHTQGKVNATYSRKVKNSPPIGAPLTLTSDYIGDAISNITTLGSLAATKSWLSLDSSATMAATGHVYLYLDDLMENEYCLQSERWQTS
ncbi:hypothetical protein ACIBQX_00555 [Nonomuraea sp. NPDC049714]|uniref:hypothetical protein n=1 Tax=Nonomuraea sp. NPDC049714 TaxID=3364357 RepID=UPI00379332CB